MSDISDASGVGPKEETRLSGGKLGESKQNKKNTSPTVSVATGTSFNVFFQQNCKFEANNKFRHVFSGTDFKQDHLSEVLTQSLFANELVNTVHFGELDVKTALEVVTELAKNFIQFMNLENDELHAATLCLTMLKNMITYQSMIDCSCCAGNEHSGISGGEKTLTPANIASKIEKDLNEIGLVCIPRSKPRVQFLMLEKVEEDTFVHEFSAVVDANASTISRKKSIYLERRTPGITFKFEEANLQDLIAEFIEDGELCSYETIRNDRRARFTASFRDDAFQTMNLIDVLSRDILQRGMAKEMHKEINARVVVLKSSGLYRMYATYCRAHLLYGHLELCTKNVENIGRNSLQFLKKCVDAFCSYVLRNKKKFLHNGTSAILVLANNIILECRNFLSNECSMKIMRIALPDAEIRINLLTNAQQQAAKYAKRITPEPITQYVPQHFALKLSRTNARFEEIAQAAKNLVSELKSPAMVQARRYELAYKAIKILRAIPTPTAGGGAEFWLDVNKRIKNSTICVSGLSPVFELVTALDSIQRFLLNLDVHNILVKGLSGTEIECLGIENYHSIALTPIVNAMAKARIVAFELVRNIDPVRTALNDFVPDWSWFISFFKSAANSVVAYEDSIDLAEMYNYMCAQSVSEGRKLFGYLGRVNAIAK
ncbi:MAG: hypothetical protein LBR91_02610 [Puniceicoccales bacterium]|jgi:hypothetical protein|nr:hypothetical protein [Puniceicoccales bacterium]